MWLLGFIGGSMDTLQFLQSRSGKRRYKTVEIDGQQIRLRSLTANERTDVNLAFMDEKRKDTRPDATKCRRALGIAKSIIDDKGEQVFPENEETYALLGNMDARDLDILDAAVVELTYEKAETLAKNSTAATPTGS